MKSILLGSLLVLVALIAPSVPQHCVGALMAQGQQLPPAGNPGHVEPPKDQFCSYASEGADPGHACACHKECVDGIDDGGNPRVTVAEDSQCRVWCFKKQCRCPVHGCE